MKEKVFATLFRLISTGQINVEEAFYLMKTLFEDHSEDESPSEDGHRFYPGTNEIGLHPWWEIHPTLTTTTSTGDTVTTTYTSATQPHPSVYTTTASINEPNVGTVSCSNPLLDGNSDITKNCINTIE